MIDRCTCGLFGWQFEIDEFGQSWIRCSECKENMFEEDIGVILINWSVTNPGNLRIELKED